MGDSTVSITAARIAAPNRASSPYVIRDDDTIIITADGTERVGTVSRRPDGTLCIYFSSAECYELRRTAHTLDEVSSFHSKTQVMERTLA